MDKRGIVAKNLLITIVVLVGALVILDLFGGVVSRDVSGDVIANYNYKVAVGDVLNLAGNSVSVSSINSKAVEVIIRGPEGYERERIETGARESKIVNSLKITYVTGLDVNREGREVDCVGTCDYAGLYIISA